MLWGFLGLISFVSIYGYNVLNVKYDDWLLNGEDITQHYLGWRFYRESNWTFPIGLVEGLVYPSMVSIIYTDSIPLFAVIFKILSPMLPDTFQYFGLWGAFSFMLQGGISAIIIKRFTNSNIIPIVSSIFFIISPVVIQRMFGHTSLAGHWIILLAIAICVYKDYLISLKKNIIYWSILLSLAVSVHMYFVPMIVAIMVFYLIRGYVDNKKIIEPIIILVSAITSALLTMYILGAFYGNSDIAQYGLGIYSANLNTLLNSQGTSKFILQLPMATDGQYEGYAYLGIGIIILLIIAIVSLIDNFELNLNLKNRINKNIDLTLCIISMVILFIFALSPSITLNDKIIANVPLPYHIYSILGIFRASGRFMWPIMYILMILSIISLIRNRNIKSVIIILITCCLLQVTDLSTFIKSKNDYFSNERNYTSQLISEVWKELSKDHNELVFINIEGEGISEILSSYYDMKTIFDIGLYAINYHMFMNDFYIGRRDSKKISDYRYSQWKKLETGQASENIIYIFNNIPYTLLENKNINLYEIDNIIIGCVNPLKTSKEFNNLNKIEYSNEFNIILENNRFLSNGEDTQNGRILKKNGISYGPYIPIKNGTYKINIEGINLEKSNYDVCFDSGNIPVQLQEIKKDSHNIEFEFTLKQDVKDLEIRVMNYQEIDVAINKILLSTK